MHQFNILYTNINSYIPKKYIINNTIEKHNINCALFVESKTKPDSNTSYRNWTILQRDGNMINNNVRGGTLVQMHPALKMGKANPPRINNPLNEATHFTIPFQEDLLHVFVVYIHPTSNIEESIFMMAARFKYAMIVGDFNINAAKCRQLNQFLGNSDFIKADTPPTFLMPNNNDSTPDILLFKKIISSNVTGIDVIPDVGSDHLSIKINFDLNRPVISEEPPMP